MWLTVALGQQQCGLHPTALATSLASLCTSGLWPDVLRCLLDVKRREDRALELGGVRVVRSFVMSF